MIFRPIRFCLLSPIILLALAGCTAQHGQTMGSVRAEAKAVDKAGEAAPTIEVSVAIECKWGGSAATK